MLKWNNNDLFKRNQSAVDCPHLATFRKEASEAARPPTSPQAAEDGGRKLAPDQQRGARSFISLLVAEGREGRKDKRMRGMRTGGRASGRMEGEETTKDNWVKEGNSKRKQENGVMTGKKGSWRRS